MEEVITLMHESEAIVTAVALAGMSAAALQAASFPPRPPVTADGAPPAAPPPAVLPQGCFTLGLEFGNSALSVTSVALSTFGMLFKDSFRCSMTMPPCGAPIITSVFTGLAQVCTIDVFCFACLRSYFLVIYSCFHVIVFLQHINTVELVLARSIATKSAARAYHLKNPDDLDGVARAGAAAPKFDSLLRWVITQSDTRSCGKCSAKQLTQQRSLLKPASVITIILGWTSR